MFECVKSICTICNTKYNLIRSFDHENSRVTSLFIAAKPLVIIFLITNGEKVRDEPN